MRKAYTLAAVIVLGSRVALAATPTPINTQTPTRTPTVTPTPTVNLTPAAQKDAWHATIETLCSNVTTPSTCGPVPAGAGHKTVKVTLLGPAAGTPTPAVDIVCDPVHGEASGKIIATLHATGVTDVFDTWCDDLTCNFTALAGARASCSLRIWGADQ